MLKIQAFYRTKDDLENAKEPYRSLTFTINKLRLKGPNGKKSLSQSFRDTKALSCIRDIAEDLTKSQVTFVSRMKTLWDSLLNPQSQFTDSFENYSVPYEYYQGIIFGGVYYVLSKQKNVTDEHLDMLVTFVSDYPEALPYFNVFKVTLIDNTLPLVPHPSTNAAIKATDTKSLLKQFIQRLNNHLIQIDAIDWADATMGFERDIMKELFWGIENSTFLKTITNAIINTWNKLIEIEDKRCMVKVSNAATALTAINKWKFDGIFNETINQFFDNLWVERRARDTYATSTTGNLTTLQKSQPTPTHDTPADETEAEKVEPNNSNVEIEQLSKKLTKAEAEKKEMTETIASLQNDLMAFKTRDKKAKEFPVFTAKQVAIFIKALFLEHNSLTNNVKNLAPLLQRFGGWAPTTAEGALGYEVTQDECNELAEVFNLYAPHIGTIIKAYPDRYRQKKSDRLQNNLKS